MMWPWQRQRLAVEQVQREVEEAAEARRAAQRRRELAQRQAVQSNAMTARLRREIDKNGFTELLEKAWARR